MPATYDSVGVAQTVSITVGPKDRTRLAAVLGDRNRPLKHVQRVNTILLSAARLPVLEVSRRAGVSCPAVGRWQVRYAEQGGDGLLRDKTCKPGQALGQRDAGLLRQPVAGCGSGVVKGVVIAVADGLRDRLDLAEVGAALGNVGDGPGAEILVQFVAEECGQDGHPRLCRRVAPVPRTGWERGRRQAPAGDRRCSGYQDVNLIAPTRDRTVAMMPKRGGRSGR